MKEEGSDIFNQIEKNEIIGLTEILINEGPGSQLFETLSDYNELDRYPHNETLQAQISLKKSSLGYRTAYKRAETVCHGIISRNSSLKAHDRMRIIARALNDADAYFVEQQQNSSQQ